MRPFRLALLAIAAAAAAFATAPGLAQADVPSAGALYKNGPSGRYLVGGQWLFRLDRTGQGLSSGWMRNFSTAGWTPTTVPNAWNADDYSVASMKGTVGWYRKDFT